MTLTSEPKAERATGAAHVSSAFDPHLVRRDFPILEQVINGHPLV
jgi:hypothetical protein